MWPASITSVISELSSNLAYDMESCLDLVISMLDPPPLYYLLCGGPVGVLWGS